MPGYELYFISGSPPCWSVMLALEWKGLDYEPRRLDNSKGEQKSDAFLAINPRGQVPVLVNDTLVVCETLAILAYLEAAHPAKPLFGASAEETAAIWQGLYEFESALREPVGKISRPIFRGRTAEQADEITSQAGRVGEELGRLSDCLTQHRWLVGDTPSAADFIVFPILKQLERATLRDEAQNLGLQLTPFAEHFPAVAKWAESIEALPGYARAYPPHWR